MEPSGWKRSNPNATNPIREALRLLPILSLRRNHPLPIVLDADDEPTIASKRQLADQRLAPRGGARTLYCCADRPSFDSPSLDSLGGIQRPIGATGCRENPAC